MKVGHHTSPVVSIPSKKSVSTIPSPPRQPTRQSELDIHFERLWSDIVSILVRCVTSQDGQREGFELEPADTLCTLLSSQLKLNLAGSSVINLFTFADVV